MIFSSIPLLSERNWHNYIFAQFVSQDLFKKSRLCLLTNSRSLCHDTFNIMRLNERQGKTNSFSFQQFVHLKLHPNYMATCETKTLVSGQILGT